MADGPRASSARAVAQQELHGEAVAFGLFGAAGAVLLAIRGLLVPIGPAAFAILLGAVGAKFVTSFGLAPIPPLPPEGELGVAIAHGDLRPARLTFRLAVVQGCLMSVGTIGTGTAMTEVLRSRHPGDTAVVVPAVLSTAFVAFLCIFIVRASGRIDRLERSSGLRLLAGDPLWRPGPRWWSPDLEPRRGSATIPDAARSVSGRDRPRNVTVRAAVAFVILVAIDSVGRYFVDGKIGAILHYGGLGLAVFVALRYPWPAYRRQRRKPPEPAQRKDDEAA